MNQVASDETLVREHLSGQAGAFEELFRRHRNRVYSLCYHVLGNPEDAADAAQDAFLSAYRSLGGFKGKAAFSTWLHRVAVNAALDLARRRSHTATVPLDPKLHADSTGDHARATETALVVAHALAGLPLEFRAAVVLRDVQALSYEEAAAALDTPVGTAKSRVHRGRAMLAEALEEFRSGGRITPSAAGGNSPTPKDI